MNEATLVLGAGANYFSGIISALYAKSRSGNLTIFALVAVFALAWAGIYLWERHRKSDGRTGKPADDLFFDLCKSHALNRQDSRTLMKAAKSWGLPFPETMFVDPQLLAQMAASEAPYSPTCARLCRHLFDPQELANSN